MFSEPIPSNGCLCWFYNLGYQQIFPSNFQRLFPFLKLRFPSVRIHPVSGYMVLTLHQLLKSCNGDYMAILKWGLNSSCYVVIDIWLFNDAILTTVFHELINSIWNTGKLPDHWKESIIIPVHNKGDKTDCSNYRVYHYYQLRTKFYRIFFSQG
jgi:hypothetical protein